MPSPSDNTETSAPTPMMMPRVESVVRRGFMRSIRSATPTDISAMRRSVNSGFAMLLSSEGFVAQRSDRREDQLAELDFRALSLERDLTVVRGSVGAGVHEIAVHPHLDRAANRLDHHTVPLTQRILGVIGEIDDPACLSLGDTPGGGWSAAALHVRHANVFDDAPEIAGIAVLHLHLDRLREHSVERSRRGRVHQHARIARIG